jgi:hypothetical protein
VDYCDLPEIKKEDFNGEVFARYVAANKPFIVRGYGADWPMRIAWRRDNFLSKYGHLRFKTGSIGYADAYGHQAPEMTVREYIEYMESDHTRDDGFNETLAIFQNGVSKTHPELTNDFDSFPQVLKDLKAAGIGFQSGGVGAGEQFYLGQRNSGTQPHVHNHAWNMMAFGRKRWYLWTPDDAFYTTMPMRPYIDQVLSTLPPGKQPLTCVQEGGDFVYVANGWGHSVLNLEDSVGIAIGFRDAFTTPFTTGKSSFYGSDRCPGHAQYGQ